MCGRYALSAPVEEIAETFGVTEAPPVDPRYNIAPTQSVPVVRAASDGRRELVEARWGLVPAWFADPDSGPPLINARSESLATRPTFRDAFRLRRCILPASGFYEWQRVDRGKQPYFVRRRDGRLLGLAGLWERWPGPAGVLESCVVITVPANEALVEVHDRMPAILSGELVDRWLDPAGTGPELGALLAPYPSGELEIYPVSPRVNRAEHDDAECVEPLG